MGQISGLLVELEGWNFHLEFSEILKDNPPNPIFPKGGELGWELIGVLGPSFNGRFGF